MCIINILHDPSEINKNLDIELMIKVSNIISETDYFHEDFLKSFLSSPQDSYDVSLTEDEYVNKYYNYDFFGDWRTTYYVVKESLNKENIIETFSISGIPKTGQLGAEYFQITKT